VLKTQQRVPAQPSAYDENSLYGHLFRLAQPSHADADSTMTIASPGLAAAAHKDSRPPHRCR
jgi:hypothetical protein